MSDPFLRPYIDAETGDTVYLTDEVAAKNPDRYRRYGSAPQPVSAEITDYPDMAATPVNEDGEAPPGDYRGVNTITGEPMP